MIKKGRFIVTTHENYLSGVFECLKEFDPGKLLKQWATETDRDVRNGVVDHSDQILTSAVVSSKPGPGYADWLVAKEYIKMVDYVEMHTGAYQQTDITMEAPTS